MIAPPCTQGAAIISASGLPCCPAAGWRGRYSATVKAPPCTQGAAFTLASGLLCCPAAGWRGCFPAAMRAPPSKLGAALISASCLPCCPADGEQDKCFTAGGLSRHGWPEPLWSYLPKAVAAARSRAHITHPPTPSVRGVSALPRKRGAAATPLPPIYCAGYDRFLGLRRIIGPPDPLEIINEKSPPNIWSIRQ